MPKNRKYPTLYVKNFAKIKEAEIELAPFTLFIGDNNSGKSYLASLIWYIQNSDFINKFYDYKYYKDFKLLNNLLDSILNNYNFEMEINNNFIDEFITVINKIFSKNKNKITEELFNHKSINIEKLYFTSGNVNYDNKITIKSNISESKFEEEATIKIISIDIIYLFNKYSRYESHYSIINSDNINTTKEKIITFIMYKIMNIIFTNFYDILFLPVARTGLVLLKDIVINKAVNNYFEDKTSEEKNTIILTMPVKDFFYKLSALKRKNIENKIIKFIENNITKGKIYLDNMPLPQVHYKNNNSDIDFQMHVSSAVITELTPLILFLKYSKIENIIMEEPEISLHPYLQQQLTRVFIKLVNSGKNVLITTHSDTIVQHINNMIKLNANEKKRQKKLMEKYKYDEDDIISEDKIRMYQFDVKEDGTEVKALESSKYGFEAPTFHKYLVEISKEFDDFIENIGENNSI